MSSTTTPAPDHFDNLQKQRRGWARLWHAGGYSLQGLRAGWDEAAFRLEVALAAVLLPASLLLGRSLAEKALLACSTVLVLVVELLNSAIESAVDRIGLQYHPLSKRAKDAGSAAVLLVLLMCAAVWLTVGWARFSV